MTLAKTLNLSLVSPARTYYEGSVSYVQAPIHDGLIGILLNHAPLMSVLGFGLLTLRDDKGERSFVVDGGFLEIFNNKVTVLANSAADVREVDVQAAKSELQKALETHAVGETELEERMEKIAAARNRIKYGQGAPA